MYTLEIKDGDLVIGAGGIPQTVSGRSMLQQELGSRLIEPVGSDPFHPSYGSTLHENIGAAVTTSTKSAIRSEVASVVQSYIDYQGRRIRDAALSGERQYSSSDIIQSVDSIDVDISRDTVSVAIKITTMDGAQTVIEREF